MGRRAGGRCVCHSIPETMTTLATMTAEMSVTTTSHRVDAAGRQTRRIAMTTGGNPTSGRASAMTTLRGHSAAVREMTGKGLPTTAMTIVMMHVGESGTATIVSAIWGA
jgi:hypothetical protein